MYPVGKPGFRGGTELMVERLAHGLAGAGNIVHVVTPDLDREEQRSPGEWWWGPRSFPTHADVAVLVHSLEFVREYDAEHYVFATNGIDAWAGPDGQWAELIDAFPVFSDNHAKLLCLATPTVDRAKCHITGLGVDLLKYPPGAAKVPGRIFFSNDPSRGLFHMLDIFDAVRRQVPHATLHVGYDFTRQFELRKWNHQYLAQQMWEMKRRIESTPGVVDLGALTPGDVFLEQLACEVHVMPSDPNNTGTQIHGIQQMECAAAGCPLVLSDIEAFPEVFGEAAICLPVPGTWVPQLERRIDAEDWAAPIVELMTDKDKWREASQKARALAERHTWDAVVDKWGTMLNSLTAVKEAVPA